MKRYGNLWSSITAWDNLVLASRLAQRGKRYRDYVLRFNDRLEEELLTIQDELLTHTYEPGQYLTFEIVEPKKRMISAAPYRDRVVHHALCNIIVPLIERSFIAHTYANRRGLGTHRALRQFASYARHYRYVLQGDIKKYFPSIDHAILRSIVRKKLKCRSTLWLVDTIIAASNEQEPADFYFPGDDLFTPMERRKGLPIGNLTSQFFGNLYLSSLDHFVTEKMSWGSYIRYVDDFALFDDDRERLEDARKRIEDYLALYRLKLHPVKTQILDVAKGPAFVGFRVLPDRIRVRGDNLRRSRLRFKKYKQDCAAGRMTQNELTQCVRSWIAHLAHGQTWRLRERVFASLRFTFQRG